MDIFPMLVYYCSCAFTVATLLCTGFIGEEICLVFLHAGSSMAAQLVCWCICGSKCRGSIEPERKMPLFLLGFCSTLALADDYFQSTFLSVAVPITFVFLFRCPHQSHQGSLLYARHPLYSDTPFPITELEEVLGMVWDRVDWLGRNCCGCGTDMTIWEYPRPLLQCEFVYIGVKTAYGSKVEVLDFFLLGFWVQIGLMEWFLLQRHLLVKGSWQLASPHLGKCEAVE